MIVFSEIDIYEETPFRSAITQIQVGSIKPKHSWRKIRSTKKAWVSSTWEDQNHSAGNSDCVYGVFAKDYPRKEALLGRMWAALPPGVSGWVGRRKGLGTSTYHSQLSDRGAKWPVASCSKVFQVAPGVQGFCFWQNYVWVPSLMGKQAWSSTPDPAPCLALHDALWGKTTPFS